jgi:hypothetical protein
MKALDSQSAPNGRSHGYNPDEPRDDHGRWTIDEVGASATHLAAQKTGTISYGLLRTPAASEEELAQLRRQQQALAKAVLKPDAENAWLAFPALAAILALTIPEDAAAWVAGETLPEVGQAPLDLPERDPYRRVGDNWSTRKGMKAHADNQAKVASKPGWDPKPTLERPGKRPLRPDAATPARNPEEPDKRYYLELKPNTPSGRAAAARAVKRYKEVTKNKVRAIYYDPKKIK